MLKLISKIPLWGYLLLTAASIFYTHDLIIAYDMGQYMNWALNIFNGKGYSNLTGTLSFHRGPLFPLMIAGSYWLLGVSAWSAFWVVRLFCVLNPIVIYFLGKKLYGKWVGFSAAFLILSSYSMSFWAYRHIDPVWPFFVFLSMLLFYEGLEKNNQIYIAFSGASIGFSYLIKEVAVFLFPFPLLYIIFTSELRGKKNINNILIFYAALLLSVSPWLFYLWNYEALPFVLGKTGYKTISKISFKLNAFDRLFNYVKGFVSFYSGIDNPNSVTRNFFLAPVFVAVWGFVFAKTIKGDKGSILLLCTVICFLPVICFVGINKLRLGQGLFIYYLCYLSIAYLIWDLSGALFRLKNSIFPHEKLFHRSIFFLVLIVIIMAIQIFLGKNDGLGYKKLIERSYAYQILKSDINRKNIKGDFGYHNRKVGDWIRKNIPPRSRFIADREYPIYFYTGGQYTLFGMPSIYSVTAQDSDKSNEKDRIIYLRSNKAGIHPATGIFVLLEAQFLSFLENNKINYIIIHRRLNYLSIYLDENESFKKVKEFSNGAIKVYKVTGTEKVDKFRPMITNRIIYYLNELKKEDQRKLEWYINNFFSPVLGWNYDDVEKLVNLKSNIKSDRFVVVRENRIY